MAEIIRMPRMSDTMEEGVIVEWLKKEGDALKPGDVLAEVETDKATMELENYHEGYLLHIGVKAGPVPVNGILAVIGEKGEDYKAQLEKEQQKTSTPDQSTPSETKEKDTPNQDPATNTPASNADKSLDPTPSVASNTSRIKASPLAKAMAGKAGITLESISGTGENGRITKKDVESFMQSGNANKEAPAPSAPLVYAPDEAPEDFPISQMRKTIARRLGESKFTAPHFYLTVELDMKRAMAARKQVNEMSGFKISYNDLVIKACAMALRSHPAVNSSWMENTIRHHKQIHIGVAVAVNDGLLVPVVTNTDYKTLQQINSEVKLLAGKAKDKKLQPQEMQGNTFTVSNLGMFGIEEFTAIINPPDACIMAVGTIVEKPVVENGSIVVGHRMKVTLSCDHRVVDGATGAKFLQTFKQLMEEPVMMLV